MRSVARSCLVLASLALAATGCGRRGAPLPPEPRGPLPPQQVEARQLDDQVLVAFRVPQARGSRPMQQPVRAELVRIEYAPGVQPPADPDAFRRRGRVLAALDEDPLPEGARRIIEDSTVGAGGFAAKGWTLRYGIRVRDRRGRSSPLVVAVDLIPVELPSAPAGLQGRATAEGVRLEWQGEGEGRTFNVYRSEPGKPFPWTPLNPAPVGARDWVDREVVTGTTYLYEVRAAAGPGVPRRESAGSNTARVVAEDRFPPARPDGVVAVQEGAAVRLFWNPNGEPDLAGYRVYRSVDNGDWQRIAERVEQSLFLDSNVRAGQYIRYRITAIDLAQPPNESLHSEMVELEVGAEAAGD